VIFVPNSGYIARYAPFIWRKSPTNCEIHLAASIFKHALAENEARTKQYYLCLKEQDQAFPEYRYMCKAKAMSANPVFLFAFAHILKFVYESLVRENGKDEELR